MDLHFLMIWLMSHKPFKHNIIVDNKAQQLI